MKTKHFVIPLALILWATNLAKAQETLAEVKPVADYIRYQAGGEGQPDVLQTAVSRFQKGNHIIDLVSMVHLGDADYFARLKQALTAYDTVFYEMVGGPYTEEKARISKEAASPDGNLAQIQGLQQMATRLLGLDFQLDGLDYLAPNFVHADMTADQASELSGGLAGQNMSDLIARALKVAQSGKVRGMPQTDAEANQLMTKVMGAALTGNSNQLKRSLGPILAEAESFITQMEGDEGSVLISKRNEIVIDKINETSDARGPGPKKDAVLYGAGHMPDLEDRLKEIGFSKANTVWESSWVIEEGAIRNDRAPSLDEMLKQVGGLMKMMKGE